MLKDFQQDFQVFSKTFHERYDITACLPKFLICEAKYLSPQILAPETP